MTTRQDGGFLRDATTGALVISGGGTAVTTRNVTGATALAVSEIGGAFVDTLTGDVTYSAPTGCVAGTECAIDLKLVQDATGSRAVTWFAGITWIQGSAPSIPTSAGSSLLVSFVSLDGGSSWYGSYNASAAIEAWRVVGAASQPAFGTGYSNAGAPSVLLQFAKTSIGTVLIEGVVTRTVTTGFPNETIFTLPAGYRPLSTLKRQALVYVSGSTFNHADLKINADGTVVLSWVGASLTSGTSQIPLSYMFRAEQ